MKITHIISNKSWGGGEQYVLDLCNHLRKDDYDVSILVRPIESVTRQLSLSNLKTASLTLSNLMAIDSDVVHVHNFKDARKVAFCRLLARKKYSIIVTRHLIRPAKTGWLYTWLYKQIDKVIFVSQLACDTFLSSQPKIQHDKISVVRNSIIGHDESKDAPSFRGKEEIALMYHGRIAEEKGLRTLISALALLSDVDCHLYLIGTGDYTDTLKTVIKDYNLQDKVTFLGFKENVMSYICHADIGIIPTIAQEACGLSCMEYMAAGKCVITTDNGGQREYIKSEETGLLVTPGDSESLAEAIRYSIKDKRYLDIGRRAATFFKDNLSYDLFYNKIVENYNSL